MDSVVKKMARMGVFTLVFVVLSEVATLAGDLPKEIKLSAKFGGGFVLKGGKAKAWGIVCNAMPGGVLQVVAEDILLSFDDLNINHRVVKYVRPFGRDRAATQRALECPTGALAVATDRLLVSLHRHQRGEVETPEVISHDFRTQGDQGYRVAGIWGQPSVSATGSAPLEITFVPIVYDFSVMPKEIERNVIPPAKPAGQEGNIILLPQAPVAPQSPVPQPSVVSSVAPKIAGDRCVNPFEDEGVRQQLRDSILRVSEAHALEQRESLGKDGKWQRNASSVYTSILNGLAYVESNFGENIGKCGGLLAGRIEFAVYALAIFGSENFLEIPASVPRTKGHFGGAVGPFQILPATLWHEFGGDYVTWREGYTPFTERMSRRKSILQIQTYLNTRLTGSLSVDGQLGAQTKERIKAWWDLHRDNPFYAPFFNSHRCEGEVKNGEFGKCIKILVNQEHALFGRKPRIQLNPFLPGESAFAALQHMQTLAFKGGKGYLIHRHEATVDRGAVSYAAGAYFAGPRRAYSSDGQWYAKKLLGVM